MRIPSITLRGGIFNPLPPKAIYAARTQKSNYLRPGSITDFPRTKWTRFSGLTSRIVGEFSALRLIQHRIFYPVARKNNNEFKGFKTAVPTCARDLREGNGIDYRH